MLATSYGLINNPSKEGLNASKITIYDLLLLFLSPRNPNFPRNLWEKNYLTNWLSLFLETRLDLLETIIGWWMEDTADNSAWQKRIRFSFVIKKKPLKKAKQKNTINLGRYVYYVGINQNSLAELWIISNIFFNNTFFVLRKMLKLQEQTGALSNQLSKSSMI